MAEKIARAVGINSWTSSQNLVDQLRNAHFWDLTSSQDGWLDLATPRGFGPFDWVPCVEPAGVPEQRFLTADPQTLMRSGNFLQMPAIIGYMSVESLFMARESIFDDTVPQRYAANPHYYVPQSYNLNPVTQAAQVNEVATTFRSMYFGGGHPSNAPGARFTYTEYCSDHHFAFGIDRTIRYHSARQTQPMYYYKFTMDGGLNMIKRLLLLTDYDGAVHADVSPF